MIAQTRSNVFRRPEPRQRAELFGFSGIWMHFLVLNYGPAAVPPGGAPSPGGGGAGRRKGRREWRACPRTGSGLAVTRQKGGPRARKRRSAGEPSILVPWLPYCGVAAACGAGNAGGAGHGTARHPSAASLTLPEASPSSAPRRDHPRR